MCSRTYAPSWSGTYPSGSICLMILKKIMKDLICNNSLSCGGYAAVKHLKGPESIFRIHPTASSHSTQHIVHHQGEWIHGVSLFISCHRTAVFSFQLVLMSCDGCITTTIPSTARTERLCPLVNSQWTQGGFLVFQNKDKTQDTVPSWMPIW